MAQMTTGELERRLAELEAENAALLRTRAADAVAEERPRPGRSWGWALLSVALILIGMVLAPVAVVASWARVELTDTESFVATFAPLAEEEAVQSFVTDQAMVAITDAIDIPALTTEVVDGIIELGTPPRATAALEALTGPAAAGIRSLIETQIAGFVQSDAFADVWATALRVSHRQLVATMEGDPDAAVTLGANGEIGVQLAPIIEAVKTALVERGIGLAEQIPVVDRTITVATSEAVPTAQLGYGLAVAAGAWLPWVSIGLLAAGVLVARRRSVALIASAAVLALVMVLLLALFAVGHAVFTTSIAPGVVPGGVSGVLFETVVERMRSTTVAVLTLAVVVALVGWFAGPFEVPRRLRALAASAADALRDAVERRGVTTGRVGLWLHRQRVLLRAAVAVIASLVILFVRPLSPPTIVWTLVVALVALAVLELAQRPPAVVPSDDNDVDKTADARAPQTT